MSCRILGATFWVCLFTCVTSGHSAARPNTLPDVYDIYESRQVTLLKQIRTALHALERRLDELDRNKGGLCREVSGAQRACYKLVRAEVSWSQARTYCQSIAPGADLVSIESEIEQIFLVDAILDSQHPCQRFHTSGRKNSSGAWVWQGTGRPFNYTAWGPGEPSGNGDHCVLWERMQKWTLWDDENSRVKSCFICEIP
ncbi:hypothetical protein LSAT2_031802 [Lamellibrachia satsuma]|nr:hypothetical protein LSAT2_031802 [Lamellibrachia satsuma]